MRVVGVHLSISEPLYSLTNIVESGVAEVLRLLPECRGPILEGAHARLHRRVLWVRRPGVPDDARGGLAVPRRRGRTAVRPPDDAGAWKREERYYFRHLCGGIPRTLEIKHISVGQGQPQGGSSGRAPGLG